MKRRDFIKSIMAGAVVTQVPTPDVKEEVAKISPQIMIEREFLVAGPSDNVFWDENKRMFCERIYVDKSGEVLSTKKLNWGDPAP